MNNKQPPLLAPMYNSRHRNIKKYIINIELQGTSYQVSRKLSVPSNTFVGYLGEILIHAMGWSGNHIIRIEKDNIQYITPADIKRRVLPEMKWVNSFDTTVRDLLKRPSDQFFIYYEVAGWEHIITLERIETYDSFEYPVIDLLSGEGCCPPDDCGGPLGFYLMQEDRHDRNSPNYIRFKDRLSRCGLKRFNEKQFNLRELKFRVQDYQRLMAYIIEGEYMPY